MCWRATVWRRGRVDGPRATVLRETGVYSRIDVGIMHAEGERSSLVTGFSRLRTTGRLHKMQSRFIRRARVAAALSGIAVMSAGGHASGAGFALQENSGSAIGNAFAGGAAAAEDASTRVVESGRHVAARVAGGFAGRALHHAVVQVPRRRIGAGSIPAARRNGRRRGQPQRRAEPVRRGADQSAMERRRRRQRAVRPRHRIRRQLDRPLPGASSPTSRRSTSIRRSRGASPTRSRSAPA